MLADYHLHTPMCGHAVGQPIEYVRAAVAKGLGEVGFSDHIIFHIDNRGYSMHLSMLPAYIEAIENLKEAFQTIPIRVGVEVDYFPGKGGEIEATLDTYPFDYVLGSVHCIGDWFFDDSRYAQGFEGKDIDKLYEEYFRLFQQAAETRLFDAMSHPDLIKKFGYRPKMSLQPLYEEAASLLGREDICIEVNTSGLYKPAREIYPHPALLRLCRKHGVPAILGSDAHSPDEVGRGFKEAVALLTEAGYREITLMDRKRKRSVSIL